MEAVTNVPIKLGVDGIGAILERIAIHLARKLEEFEMEMALFHAGKMIAPVKIDQRSGKNIIDPEQWRNGVIRSLESRLKSAQRDAMQFMKCHIQHRNMEERMGKTVTRTDKKEFLVNFFWNELSETEQQELKQRLSNREA
jgi:hypothetical protein